MSTSYPLWNIKYVHSQTFTNIVNKRIYAMKKYFGKEEATFTIDLGDEFLVSNQQLIQK